MTKRMAAAIVMAGVVGTGVSYAAEEIAAPFPDLTVPEELTKRRYVGRRPFVIGDLKPASDDDAQLLMRRAADDDRLLSKCVETGAGVLQWSREGTSIELAPSWGWAAETNVATAYCDDTVVLLGGSRREAEDGELRTWLFYWIRTPGHEYGPVSILTRKSYAYNLTELMAIDPISRQLLFSGTSADGRELLLAARFAILPRR